jgi:hypothetical protein
LWWVLGALMLLAIGQAFFLAPAGRQIPYSEFKAMVRGGQVAEVQVGRPRTAATPSARHASRTRS